MRRIAAAVGILLIAGCASSPDSEGINVYAEAGLANATAFELWMPDGVLVTVTGDDEVAHLAAPLDAELPMRMAGDCADGIGLVFYAGPRAIELTYCGTDRTLGGDGINGVHVPVPDEFTDIMTGWIARAVPPAP